MKVQCIRAATCEITKECCEHKEPHEPISIDNLYSCREYGTCYELDIQVRCDPVEEDAA